uniref:BED-type domain-containing protein n=1 Tax=Rhabditophanes sp. KR3021 TaxID=114890 RepID=A0AC35TW64_9BILA
MNVTTALESERRSKLRSSEQAKRPLPSPRFHSKISEVWKHYQMPDPVSFQVLCLHCGKRMKRSDSSTKSMWGHLKAFHKDLVGQETFNMKIRKRKAVRAVSGVNDGGDGDSSKSSKSPISIDTPASSTETLTKDDNENDTIYNATSQTTYYNQLLMSQMFKDFSPNNLSCLMSSSTPSSEVRLPINICNVASGSRESSIGEVSSSKSSPLPQRETKSAEACGNTKLTSFVPINNGFNSSFNLTSMEHPTSMFHPSTSMLGRSDLLKQHKELPQPMTSFQCTLPMKKEYEIADMRNQIVENNNRIFGLDNLMELTQNKGLNFGMNKLNNNDVMMSPFLLAAINNQNVANNQNLLSQLTNNLQIADMNGLVGGQLNNYVVSTSPTPQPTSISPTTFSLIDGYCLSSLLTMSKDLNAIFSYSSDKNSEDLSTDEFMFTSKLENKKSIILRDFPDEIKIFEKCGDTMTASDSWRKTDWSQMQWALRGKVQSTLFKV